MKKIDETEVWQRYQRGVKHHDTQNLYANTEKAYNFYEDRQWEGVTNEGEELPFHNFIKQIVRQKVASVSMNNMEIVYSALNSDENQGALQGVCEVLNKYAARQWELLKMETKGWQVNKEAAISGDAYLYFYDQEKCQIISNTNIYFADEQSSDIQGQKYIIIEERLFVDDIKENAKKYAKEYGYKVPQLDFVVSDSEILHQTNVDNEVETDDGKCTSLLMFEKKDGVVYFSRSVKNLIYQPEQSMGMKEYPIAGLVWGQKKNSSRGQGEVLPLIPNQIEANRTLVRRAIAVKQAAFPRLVYDEDKISNPDSIDKVGMAIALSGTNAQSIKNIVDFLYPAPISQDAKNLSDELIQVTKDLAGASDAMLGSVDPTKASGTAIIAVRDQAMIPLNEQVQRYRQFIEDIARIQFSSWIAYNPNGLEITIEEQSENGIQNVPVTITAEALQELNVHIKVDVSPANPYSKYAQEQSLENLLNSGLITFDEYVEVLDDSSVMPKAKLERILENRMQQTGAQNPQMAQELEMLRAERESIPDMLMKAEQEGAKKYTEEQRKQEELKNLSGDDEALLKELK